MAELLKRLFNICLLASGPQDIPYSQLLFRLMITVYFVTGIMSMWPSVDVFDSVFIMILDASILLAFAWICLKTFNKTARFIQVGTTLLAIGSIFQLLAWPLIAYLDSLKDAGNTSSELSLILLALISWNLAVYAHIFRQSFEIRMLSAFIMTIAYVVINITARQILFPQTGV